MTAKRPAIAIVDDNREVRSAVASLLSVCGYRTETFGSAEEFLNAATGTKAECLLLDVHLGDISGLELARQLKATGFTFPIIFMSASWDDRLLRQALELGCAYLSKFDVVHRLIDEIERAVGSRAPACRIAAGRACSGAVKS